MAAPEKGELRRVQAYPLQFERLAAQYDLQPKQFVTFILGKGIISKEIREEHDYLVFGVYEDPKGLQEAIDFLAETDTDIGETYDHIVFPFVDEKKAIKFTQEINEASERSHDLDHSLRAYLFSRSGEFLAPLLTLTTTK